MHFFAATFCASVCTTVPDWNSAAMLFIRSVQSHWIIHSPNERRGTEKKISARRCFYLGLFSSHLNKRKGKTRFGPNHLCASCHLCRFFFFLFLEFHFLLLWRSHVNTGSHLLFVSSLNSHWPLAKPSLIRSARPIARIWSATFATIFDFNSVFSSFRAGICVRNIVRIKSDVVKYLMYTSVR